MPSKASPNPVFEGRADSPISGGASCDSGRSILTRCPLRPGTPRIPRGPADRGSGRAGGSRRRPPRSSSRPRPLVRTTGNQSPREGKPPGTEIASPWLTADSRRRPLRPLRTPVFFSPSRRKKPAGGAKSPPWQTAEKRPRALPEKIRNFLGLWPETGPVHGQISQFYEVLEIGSSSEAKSPQEIRQAFAGARCVPRTGPLRS